MKNSILILVFLAVGACSSIKTSYDYDKTADFTKYKTYNYTPEALALGIQELNRSRLIAAIDKEMTARGMTKSDSPDAMVDILVKAEQKRDATATTSGSGMYGGYGGGWRYGYGGGFTTTQINVNEYIEGTVFINLVDKATDKLVWSGRGTKVVDEEASPQTRERNINEGVKAVFKNYPVKPTATK
jgi:hypothetical protein